MTIDPSVVAAHLPHFDPFSLLAGAIGSHALVAMLVRAVRPLPALAVGKLKARVQALAAAGKIDGPTVSLLKAYSRATFAWADAELPDTPGPAKMEAVLDRLAAVPYLGWLVRADRDGARELLQAAYDSLKAEVKTEAGVGGTPA